jgi:hypothetical protein
VSGIATLFRDPLDELLAVRLEEPVDPSLVLHTTEHCNARCPHCIVWSGPERRERLDPGVARAALQGAVQVEGLERVVFSGGESFLDLDAVLGLCREATELGLRTRVITNAFWAKTPELAREVLERVRAHGVEQLVISFDRYHLPWIPAQRVRNVSLGARRAEHLPYLVFSAVIEPGPAAAEVVWSGDGIPWPRAVAELLGSYGMTLEECVPRGLVRAQASRLDAVEQEELRRNVLRQRAIVHWNLLAQGGRATRELAERVPLRSIDDDGWEACPIAGYQITVPSSGRMYPCCSVWSNHAGHGFGTVGGGDFAERALAMRLDPAVRVIREQGPVELARRARARGLPAPERCSDICHACEGLLERLSLDDLRALAAEAEEPASEVGAPGDTD